MNYCDKSSGEFQNSPSRLFRTLVLISILAYTVWFFELSIFNRLISEATLDVLSRQGDGAFLAIPQAFSWLYLFAYVTTAIGLWLFAKSARSLYAILAAINLITLGIGGLQVQTPVGSLLVYIYTLVDGAILVLAYTSLKGKFESNSKHRQID